MTPPPRPQLREPDSRAKLTTVAAFPRYYSPDNLAVRRDGPILATAVLQQELCYIPAPDTCGQAEPMPVERAGHSPGPDQIKARPQQPEPEPEPDNLGAVVSGCAGFLVNGDLTANRPAQSMEGN
jgi:hypothetical protein